MPLRGLAILHLHLHDTDIDKIHKIRSLINRGLGLGLGLDNQVLDHNTDVITASKSATSDDVAYRVVTL